MEGLNALQEKLQKVANREPKVGQAQPEALVSSETSTHNAKNDASRMSAGLQALLKMKAGNEQPSLNLNNEIAPYYKAGWLILAIFMTIGLFWGVLAPIDGAAVASGKVIVSTNRKKVQHLEGGIIAAIHVKEGQTVTVNDPLVDLLDTAARSRHIALEHNLLAKYAQVTRLFAERDNKPRLEFNWPKVSKEAANKIPELRKEQIEIITYRRNEVNIQRRTLNQQIEQLKNEVSGLENQRDNLQDQLKLLRDRLSIAEKLRRDQLFSQDQYLTLQMQETDQKTLLQQTLTQLKNLREEIKAREIEFENAVNIYQKAVVEELQVANTELQQLMEQKKELGDVLGRTAIRAPQSGVVTGLIASNIGQVIAPGEVLMEIVPQDDNLVVEARVALQDIDNVYVGQTAKIILVPYRTRYLPTIMAEVLSISPDAILDEVSGESYYAARLTISREYLKQLDEEIQLYPGMPTEVFLVTDSRTMFSYLMDPLRQSFSKAFREN
jgi:HlyD family type I secretion membrane fusion protein